MHQLADGDAVPWAENVESRQAMLLGKIGGKRVAREEKASFDELVSGFELSVLVLDRDRTVIARIGRS